MITNAKLALDIMNTIADSSKRSYNDWTFHASVMNKTILMSLPRMSGKTTEIVNAAKDGDYIICLAHKTILQDVHSLVQKSGKDIHVLSRDQYFQCREKGASYTIYFDEIKPEDVKNWYFNNDVSLKAAITRNEISFRGLYTLY